MFEALPRAPLRNFFEIDLPLARQIGDFDSAAEHRRDGQSPSTSKIAKFLRTSKTFELLILASALVGAFLMRNAECRMQNAERTSPVAYGATLPRGEGFDRNCTPRMP